MTNVLDQTKHLIKTNSTAILTAGGVSGTVVTAYLASVASFKAARAIDMDESTGGTAGDLRERLRGRSRLVWRFYVPAAVSGTVTVGCILTATKVSNRKAAAAVSAYSLTERAFAEYKEKVVEQLGEKKEQRIRDELAQDRVNANPPVETIVLGNGKVLCCELFTGRYFQSDYESLRSAANSVNAEMNQGVYATLADFYNYVGLPTTSGCGDVGWENDQLLELEFTTTMSPDGQPCIAFNYNYIKPL